MQQPKPLSGSRAGKKKGRPNLLRRNVAFDLLKAWFDSDLREASWTDLLNLGKRKNLLDYPAQLQRMLAFLQDRSLVKEIARSGSRPRYVMARDHDRARLLLLASEQLSMLVEKAGKSLRSGFNQLRPEDRVPTYLLMLYGVGLSLTSILDAIARSPKKWNEYVRTISLEPAEEWVKLLQTMYSLDGRSTLVTLKKLKNLALELQSDPIKRQKFLDLM